MAEQILTNDYSIYLGKDALTELKAFLSINTFSKCFVLVDENTKAHCLPIVIEHAPMLKDAHIIEITSGEENKHLGTCEHVWNEMTSGGGDRSSLLVNIGGGVISDLGGFCAATFKRGMAFVNVATTLLSQVDASIGGKLAVDFHGFKNHIGLFGNPKAIYIDPTMLGTLEERQVRSGYAEVLKHGLICSSQYWNEIKGADLNNTIWEMVINHSIGIKKSIVEKDPFEHAERKALNFGHTIGHAIETYSIETENVDAFLHGEAIAIGMITEAWLAKQYCQLSDADFEEIQTVILNHYGKFDISAFEVDEVMGIMSHDKKNFNNVFKFSLLNRIGEFAINIECSKEDVLESIEYYKSI